MTACKVRSDDNNMSTTGAHPGTTDDLRHLDLDLSRCTTLAQGTITFHEDAIFTKDINVMCESCEPGRGAAVSNHVKGVMYFMENLVMAENLLNVKTQSIDARFNICRGVHRIPVLWCNEFNGLLSNVNLNKLSAITSDVLLGRSGGPWFVSNRPIPVHLRVLQKIRVQSSPASTNFDQTATTNARSRYRP